MFMSQYDPPDQLESCLNQVLYGFRNPHIRAAYIAGSVKFSRLHWVATNCKTEKESPQFPLIYLSIDISTIPAVEMCISSK